MDRPKCCCISAPFHPSKKKYLYGFRISTCDYKIQLRLYQPAIVATSEYVCLSVRMELLDFHLKDASGKKKLVFEYVSKICVVKFTFRQNQTRKTSTLQVDQYNFSSSSSSSSSSFLWRCGPTRAMTSSFLRFLDHTQRRTTFGGTPLDE